MTHSAKSPGTTTTKKWPAAILFRRGTQGVWIARVHEYYMSTMVEEGWTLIVCDAQIREDDLQHTRALDTFKWGLGTKER